METCCDFIGLDSFQPLEQQHGTIPDRDAEYRLFDRVVNVRESFSVPVGLRGTIIGIKGGKITSQIYRQTLLLKEHENHLLAISQVKKNALFKIL